MDISKVVDYFKQNYRRKPSRPPKIGLELEYPLTNIKGEAIQWKTTSKTFKTLKKPKWKHVKDEGTGEIIALKCPQRKDSKGNFGYSQDVIGTDVGACTLEMSLTPEVNLYNLQKHLNFRLQQVTSAVRKNRCKVLGLGIQPITPPNKTLLAKKGRYVFFENDSTNRFIPQENGVDLHMFAITAANQVHLDVNQENAVLALNTVNKLSPLLTALTANASIWKGMIDPQWKDMREIAWDLCWTNRVEQTGIPKEFQDFSDYVETLCSFRPLMIKRENEFFQILDQKTYKEFILAQKPQEVSDVHGKIKKVKPKLSDIYLHSGFAWWDARLSPSHGTLEVRTCGAQPIEATLAIPAIALGILENLEEAQKLSSKLSHKQWTKLRFDALRNTFNATPANGKSIIPYIKRLLDIAKKGLEKRGLHEEEFLEPLEKRLSEKKSPADNIIEIFNRKGIEGVLEHSEITYPY